jgi:hypothetical protein
MDSNSIEIITAWMVIATALHPQRKRAKKIIDTFSKFSSIRHKKQWILYSLVLNKYIT